MSVDPRAMALTALLALPMVLAGCGAGAAPPPAPPASAAPSSAAAASPAPDPVAICTNQLTYWAGEELRGADAGYDYQEMGLTHEQSDALDTLVAEARARPDRAPEFVPTRARALCAALPPPTPATVTGWS